jgi:hypothetical protein
MSVSQRLLATAVGAFVVVQCACDATPTGQVAAEPWEVVMTVADSMAIASPVPWSACSVLAVRGPFGRLIQVDSMGIAIDVGYTPRGPNRATALRRSAGRALAMGMAPQMLGILERPSRSMRQISNADSLLAEYRVVDAALADDTHLVMLLAEWRGKPSDQNAFVRLFSMRAPDWYPHPVDSIPADDEHPAPLRQARLFVRNDSIEVVDQETGLRLRYWKVGSAWNVDRARLRVGPLENELALRGRQRLPFVSQGGPDAELPPARIVAIDRDERDGSFVLARPRSHRYRLRINRLMGVQVIREQRGTILERWSNDLHLRSRSYFTFNTRELSVAPSGSLMLTSNDGRLRILKRSDGGPWCWTG